MPYTFGEGDPGWEEYMEDQEQAYEVQQAAVRPLGRFTYVEPEHAKATVLTFPHEPVPAAPRPKPGVLARLGLDFGRTAPAAAPTTPVVPGSEDWLTTYYKEQAEAAARALASVATQAARLRGAGVVRVHGRYDGGNDEGFSHLDAVEMRDSRRLAGQDANADGAEDLVENAVVALVGTGYGTGPYELYGAVIIDCDACTITDVKDRDLVFTQDTEAG
jgi:subtilisin family serine protease